MIDVCFGSIFSCLTYSNLLRFPFFMKLAHRHLFAVLFSFQRTIALSDLISLSRHFSFVKQIFLFFLCFFRAVYRLTDGGYYPIILFIFCQADFSDFIGIFVSSHTCFLFLLTLAPSDGSAATFPDKRGRLFCVSHFGNFGFSLYIHFSISAHTCSFRQLR